MMNGASTKANKKQPQKNRKLFPVKWSKLQVWLLRCTLYQQPHQLQTIYQAPTLENNFLFFTKKNPNFHK